MVTASLHSNKTLRFEYLVPQLVKLCEKDWGSSLVGGGVSLGMGFVVSKVHVIPIALSDSYLRIRI